MKEGVGRDEGRGNERVWRMIKERLTVRDVLIE